MKKLKLWYIEDTKHDFVVFGIEEQTYRGQEFGDNGNEFKTKHNVIFASEGFPSFYMPYYNGEINVDPWVINVRGIHWEKDSNAMIASVSFFYQRIIPAVKEYNEYYADSDISSVESEDLVKGYIE